ncbi:MAG TPA: glucosaminidase domain-containing protein [Acidimicrobiales bacterium]|nr:glucosaminidase domain-containing protein [Acidimicrobiales bacterium]
MTPVSSAPVLAAPVVAAPLLAMPAAAPSPPPGTAAPGAPPVDYSTIKADQIAIVTLRHQAEIARDNQRMNHDRGVLQADQASLTGDQAYSARASARSAAAQRTLDADTAAHLAALAARRAAAGALAADRSRLRGIAVVLYEGIQPPTTPGAVLGRPGILGVTSGLQGAQEDAFAMTLVQAAVTAVGHDVQGDAARVAAESARAQQLASAIGRDTADVAADRQAVAAAAATVADRQRVVATDQATVATDQGTLAAAQVALTNAVGALGGTMAVPAAGGDGSPSIMGPSALNAADLVGWFNSTGNVVLTSASIHQLAQWYMSEGAAEGVRGDIAFAQAVIETGSFTSPDSVDLNNYAGVGHCDSCPAGFDFPSPLMGVRGQLQLLHAYAVPGLVSSELPDPPAIPEVTPDIQSRRGCCQTWQSLTGVWATDPIYGPVILNLYQQMLDFAMANPSP